MTAVTTTGARILVVEDETLIAEEIEDSLRELGYEVHRACQFGGRGHRFGRGTPAGHRADGHPAARSARRHPDRRGAARSLPGAGGVPERPRRRGDASPGQAQLALRVRGQAGQDQRPAIGAGDRPRAPRAGDPGAGERALVRPPRCGRSATPCCAPIWRAAITFMNAPGRAADRVAPSPRPRATGDRGVSTCAPEAISPACVGLDRCRCR